MFTVTFRQSQLDNKTKREYRPELNFSIFGELAGKHIENEKI